MDTIPGRAAAGHAASVQAKGIERRIPGGMHSPAPVNAPMGRGSGNFCRGGVQVLLADRRPQGVAMQQDTLPRVTHEALFAEADHVLGDDFASSADVSR